MTRWRTVRHRLRLLMLLIGTGRATGEHSEPMGPNGRCPTPCGLRPGRFGRTLFHSAGGRHAEPYAVQSRAYAL